MIQARSVCKGFGSIKALQNFTCRVPAGTITALAGADGSGKSTFLALLLGLLQPDEGHILFEGQALTPERVQKDFGYMPERFALYTDLTVEENLDFFADLHGGRSRLGQRREGLLDRTGMLPFRRRRVADLSGGMRQKLALMAILIASPRLLLLDEPTTGIDPQTHHELFSMLGELRDEGHTILVATPYFDLAEKADYVVMIHRGKVLRADSPQRLIDHLPLRLLRLEPDGHPLELISECDQDPDLQGRVHLRGSHLIYLQDGSQSYLDRIPHRQVVEERPRLEDIFHYYMGLSARGVEHA